MPDARLDSIVDIRLEKEIQPQRDGCDVDDDVPVEVIVGNCGEEFAAKVARSLFAETYL